MCATAGEAQETEARGPEPGRLFRALGFATWGLTAADLTTTEVGLAQGLREGNPLMRNRALRITFKVAWARTFNKETDRAWRRGHRKTAWICRVAMTAGYVFVVGRNVKSIGQ